MYTTQSSEEPDRTKREEAAKRRVERDAFEVGCDGLITGNALITRTGKKVFPSQVTKLDGPFHCGKCLSDCVHRRCVEKIDHFAHKARLSPVVEPKDIRLHRDCQKEICEELKHEFPDGKWECERVIPEKKQKGTPTLVPDISGRINGVPVVIEVQASSMSVPKIVKRAAAYHKLGVAILWIVPLKRPFGDEIFRPRLYERYFHSIYFGRTYYWMQGDGIEVTPIHYGIAERWIDSREWYDSEGDPCSGGGYSKPYRIIKTPQYEPTKRRIKISDDFSQTLRQEFRPWNERKTVPELTTWQDKLQVWWSVEQQEDFENLYSD